MFREGEKVSGEGYFANGAPCVKCTVEVCSLKGNKIAQTITDEKGRFEIKINEKEPLLVRLIAGEGHLAEKKLEGIKEEPLANKSANKDTKKEMINMQNKEDIKKIDVKNTRQVEIDKDLIKAAVKEVLDEELNSFKVNFLDLKKDLNRVRLQDILGGIGYIVGVLGLLAMLKAKKS